MVSAIASCSQGTSIRDAAKMYNVPPTSLYRRVKGLVAANCKPGPQPYLPVFAEDRLVNYIVSMSDMGFGLSRQDIMRLAYEVAEKSGISHPFKNGAAGRKWFDNFMHRHSNLTFRKPQSLSYQRAKAVNSEIIEDFFAKLGAIYARLNLLTKPMLVYNVDETGVSLTQHKGKVITEIKRRNTHRVTACEKGKNHTVIACGSASGSCIPPMIIFPRVRIPPSFQANSPPGSLLAGQKKGWVTTELYLRWFQFFIENIPPTRPVLLIHDGHSSHISIDLIELAKSNNVHILCLPAHTTHVLQPLDVGVFSSFKHHIGLSLNKLMRSSPGRVPTTEDIPSILTEAWPKALTPLNLMSDFRKTGIHPLNQGCIQDRQCAPSKAIEEERPPENLVEKSVEIETTNANTSGSTASSMETHAPGSTCSQSISSSYTDSVVSAVSVAMDELLISPKITRKYKRKQKPSHNRTTTCITEDAFLQNLKELEVEKASSKKDNVSKKGRASNKRPAPKKGTVSKKQNASKKGSSYTRGKEAKKISEVTEQKLPIQTRSKSKKQIQAQTDIDFDSSDDNNSSCDSSSSDCECPMCGERFGDRSGTWIQCSICDNWYDIDCAGLNDDVETLPDVYHCDECLF